MLRQEDNFDVSDKEPRSSCYGCRHHMHDNEDIWYCGIADTYGGPCRMDCSRYSIRPELIRKLGKTKEQSR